MSAQLTDQDFYQMLDILDCDTKAVVKTVDFMIYLKSTTKHVQIPVDQAKAAHRADKLFGQLTFAIDDVTGCLRAKLTPAQTIVITPDGAATVTDFA